MSDINDIRLGRLSALVERYGSQKAFAESGNDISRKYISLLLTGRSSFGEKAARNLESKLGLEPYYFDQTSDVPAYRLNVDELTRVITEIESALKLTKAEITPKDKAILIAENYASSV